MQEMKICNLSDYRKTLVRLRRDVKAGRFYIGDKPATARVVSEEHRAALDASINALDEAEISDKCSARKAR